MTASVLACRVGVDGASEHTFAMATSTEKLLRFHDGNGHGRNGTWPSYALSAHLWNVAFRLSYRAKALP